MKRVIIISTFIFFVVGTIVFLSASAIAQSDSDWEEVNIYGTDQTNPDSDGDSLSDWEEVKVYRTLLISDYLINR
jgi:hypothetical protein